MEKFDSLPDMEEARRRIEIVEERNLNHLDLSNLNLAKIPEDVFELVQLQSLKLGDWSGNLENNKLKRLPPEIGKLRFLERLDLMNTQLSHLPSEIGNLQYLEKLYLGYNELTHLPAEMARLRNLDYLGLEDNDKLVSPPLLVVKQGLNAIRNYLVALDERTKEWVSKMVIVGEGGVGKTCLLDALEGKPFISNRDTTHGLDVRTLDFTHPFKMGITMQLNVWDFGGQDIYHATHQFYLTNHSLFVLVWSARLGYEAGKLYKWLETIKALAPDSPILIVATHSESRGADLPKGDILGIYPDKIKFFEVDNSNKKGIDELKEAIRYEASYLKYIGVERPKSWVKVTERVQKMDRKFLTKKELFDVFIEAGLDSINFEILATYLHELGHILYYPDEEELNDTIIIKPAWVSKHIARLLDSEELSIKEGFLSKELMQKLWNDLDTYWHDKFITLMEKFDLSYKTENNVEISLIVEKLKYEEHPKYKELWQQAEWQNEIIFKYVLDTIPAGIPTWFIARTHRFTKYIHWRNGVLLEDKEKKHLGLLIARPEQKEVWLQVRGPMPYYFFAQLRDTLELTLNRFEGLGRSIYVPCPGHFANVDCPHFFNLKHLENRLETIPTKKTIECPETDDFEHKEMDVIKMLFGVSYAPQKPRLVEQITGEIRRSADKQNSILINEIRAQNERKIETITDRIQELLKFIQLEFIKNYRLQQEIMDQTCPNLFTLKPKDSKFYNKPLETDEFELQLFCQMPGDLHPVNEGCYALKIQKKWLINISPYYNRMLNLLKWIVPILSPGAHAVLNEAFAEGTDTVFGMLKDYINKLPEISSERAEKISNSDVYKIEGSELRMVRKLLDNVDEKHHWGGLQRILTPEGHILWLCPEHIKEYK